MKERELTIIRLLLFRLHVLVFTKFALVNSALLLCFRLVLGVLHGERMVHLKSVWQILASSFIAKAALTAIWLLCSAGNRISTSH